MSTLLRNWLSRFLVLTVALMSTLALLATDADAKRFGGGKSFGRQSPNVTKQSTQPPANTAAASPQQAAPSPAQTPQRNRWLGPLAGIAAGLGLAALLSHFGMSGDFGGILLLILLIVGGYFLWTMWRRSKAGPAPSLRREPAFANAGQSQQHYQPPVATPDPVPTSAPLPGGASNSVMASFADASSWGIPDGFDKEGFARTAKVHFIRLQAAWDAKDVSDIREFTTPEMFAEVKMQLAEAGNEKTVTEVVEVNADVLGVETSGKEDLASVRFKGKIREAVGAEVQDFEEVWNLIKPHNGRTGWLLAGIQQVQ